MNFEWYVKIFAFLLFIAKTTLYGIGQGQQNGLLYRYLTDMHRNNIVVSRKGVLVGLHTQPFLCHFNDNHFEGVSMIEFRGSILQSYPSYVSNDKRSYCSCWLGNTLEFGYKQI